MGSRAAFDSYAGVDFTTSTGERLLLAPLTIRHAMCLLDLSARAELGEEWAVVKMVTGFPGMLGLEPGQLAGEDLLRLFHRMFDPANWRPEPEPWESSGEEWKRDAGEGHGWDDAIADFMVIYPGTFSPDLPWPLFCALLDRMGRFEARERLRILDSTAGAIASVFGQGVQAERMRDELEGKAFPESKQAPKWIEPDEPSPNEDP